MQATKKRPGPVLAHYLRYDAVTPDPEQPRKVFDEEGLEQLAESINENGLLQPITVRPLPLPGKERGRHYVIIAGERRWRAIGRLGWTHLPAVIRSDVDDGEAAKLQLLENIARRDLSPVEEARALGRFLEEGCTLEEISRTVGMAPSQITWRVQMLQAREDILHLVERGQVKPAVAFELSKLSLNGQAKAIRAMQGDRLSYNEVVALCSRIHGEESQGEMFPETRVSPEQQRTARTFSEAFERVSALLGKLDDMEQDEPGSIARALETESDLAERRIDEAMKGLYRVKKALQSHRMGKLASGVRV